MSAETLCFERLQVIQDMEARDGASHMALDETLLRGSSDAPVLRFYRWEQPAVSCGYFEPVAAARRVARGRGVVRRLTGGGIVEHGDDLTFGLIVPRTDAFARLRSSESYRRIHSALASALERCGIVSLPHADGLARSMQHREPNACFERPVPHDLMAGGRKVAGGAQRRNRSGLLHQGSVRPGAMPDPRWAERLRRELPLALARVCETRPLTPGELARAGTLAAAKYATVEWTDRV